jgi:hypothetical protein
MSTHDTSTPRADEGTRFCTGCGAALTGMAFCQGCGAAVDAPQPAGPFPRHVAATQKAARAAGALPPVHLLDEIEATARLGTAPTPVPPAPTARRRWPIAVACGLLAVGAVAVALIVVLGGGSSSGGHDQRAAYVDKISTAFAPVDRANQHLSNVLGGLHGSTVSAAQSAVARAQGATSGARGALGALSAPAGSEQLTTKMRQALDREGTYLSAVATALDHPANPGVAQLQTLEGNLTNSLEAVGTPINAAAENVSGADAVTAWAVSARHAAAKRHRTAIQSAPGTATAPSPYANGRDCGGGLHAGPNTSCDFAANVRAAYEEAPGGAAAVRVYSPVTHEYYSMDCSPAGSGVTCSGGNSASVTW